MCHKKGIFALCVLAVFAGWAQAGFTAETVPIGVDVGFEVDVITHTWTNEMREKVFAESRQELALYLKSVYPHWDFRHDKQPRNRSMSLRIVDPDQDDNLIEAELQLDVRSGGRLDRQWTASWLLAVDIQYRRYPKAKKMASSLTHLFKKRFIDDRNVKFREWLHERVPVARDGVWLNVSAQYPGFWIVLSMSYEAFHELSSSVFEIAGKPVTGLSEKLEAHGIGQAMPYPPVPAVAKKYDGLVVQAVRRVVAGQFQPLASRVRALTLGPVYLIKEVPPTDQDVYLFEEDTQ
ncbi:MAG: hypothetical protein HGJ94_04160 [Desulfosarcina sp.]|nr:hypothetical protein [Desulfosarcina sp.]